LKRFYKVLTITAAAILVLGFSVSADELKKKDLADHGPILPATDALDCSGAIPISCGDVVAGDNSGGVDNANVYSCVSWNETGPDAVYELTLATDQIVTVGISNLQADLDVFILSSCSENDCVAYGDAGFTTDCLPAGTYYIVVDGYNGAMSTFDLSVTCGDCPVSSDNETCETAIELCGTFDLGYSTIGAASDYPLASSSCTGWSASGGDLVYSVCLEAGGTIDVTQTGNYDMSMYLITDCADAWTSCVAGSDNCCTGADEIISYTSVGGGMYYLIVSGYSTEGIGTLYGTVTGCCTTASEDHSWGETKSLFR